MTTLQQFENDEHFLRLVRRDHDVNLVVAALEIARDQQPDLAFEPTLESLKTAVSELTRPVAMAGSDIEELRLLIDYMTSVLHLQGDYDDFEMVESSYLNQVIDSGRGIPISLSVLYMAVANELGIPLVGVAAPSHFLTQLNTDSGPLYVDAFRGGVIMDERECVEWLGELTELPSSEIYPSLKPASERQIIVRMLHNLKAIHGADQSWPAALKVQQRLTLLSPGSYREKRDLALITLRAGRPGAAIDLLESCIAVCAPEERQLLDQYLKDARRGAPLYN
ncbi:MAG: tetratricopeptide repeat protein [Fuerstiella sp.]